MEARQLARATVKENVKASPLTQVAKAIGGCIVFVAVCGTAVFIPAGILQFWNAWLFLGLCLGSGTAIMVWAALRSPQLAQSRLTVKREDQKSQRAILLLLNVCGLGMLIVAGLDRRWHWSKVPALVVAAGSVVLVAGFVLMFFVMRENAFASGTIEIQKKQRVVSTGLYSVVRHPMYLSFIVISFPIPLVLGSWYSLIPAAGVCVPVVLRILNEERFLIRELEGYGSYLKKVRYRLIPFVW
jgi:protein-S-isoprenylcysteine O-methyltransferase Ste14